MVYEILQNISIAFLKIDQLYLIFVIEHLDKHEQADVVYSNFSQAFDTIDNSISTNFINVSKYTEIKRFLKWLEIK